MNSLLNVPFFWTRKILNLTRVSKKVRNQVLGTFAVMAFSIIPLVLVIILSNGMTEGIASKYIALDSGALRVRSADLQALASLEEIDFSERILEGYCILYADDATYTSKVRGVSNEFFTHEEVNRELLSLRGTLELSDPRRVIISEAVAEELNVEVGERIAVAAVNYDSGQTYFKPSIFEVGGIISSGYDTLDRSLVFLQYDGVKRISESSFDAYSQVWIEDTSIQNSRRVGELIKSILPDSDITLWSEIHASLFRTFAETKNILYVIMSLIILIAGINVSSAAVMLIQENYVNIGVLKAIGANSRTIWLTFLSTAVGISMAGALLGMGLGIVLGFNLNGLLKLIAGTGVEAISYYLIDIPIIIRADQMFTVFFFTLAASLLAVTLPLRQIKSITPMEILTDRK